MKIKNIYIYFCIFLFFVFCKNKEKSKSELNHGQKIKTDILKVGYHEYPPLTYTDKDGNIKGEVHEIVKKTLDKAGFQYQIKTYPAKRLYEYLKSGEIDLWPGVKYIPELKKLTITAKPIFKTINMCIFCLDKTPMIKKKEDLKSKTVILTRGFTYITWGAWIRDIANQVHFIETDSHERSFHLLDKKKADYLLTYKAIANNIIKKLNLKKEHFKYKCLSKWDLYFVFSNKTKNVKQLIKKIEIAYYQLNN